MGLKAFKVGVWVNCTPPPPPNKKEGERGGGEGEREREREREGGRETWSLREVIIGVLEKERRK